LEEGADPERILPVTFTNVAAEDLQREMLQIGVPGCENIRGFTLHSLCMRILSRQSVLDALGRTPRPLNKFEIEPLLYDLSKDFGDKRARNKRIRAYEAAWARLQHEMPGYAQTDDAAFESSLLRWLAFHEGIAGWNWACKEFHRQTMLGEQPFVVGGIVRKVGKARKRHDLETSVVVSRRHSHFVPEADLCGLPIALGHPSRD
jgi:hypothetical protein